MAKKIRTSGLIGLLTAGALALSGCASNQRLDKGNIDSYENPEISGPKIYRNLEINNITSYRSKNSSKKILYIPQAHMAPSGREETENYIQIREVQEDIAELIGSLCVYDKYCLVASEGNLEELSYESLDKHSDRMKSQWKTEHPELSDDDLENGVINNFSDYHDLALKYLLRDRIKIVATEDPGQLSKALELQRRYIGETLDHISGKKINHNLEALREEKQDALFDRRSEIGVRKTLESMAENGVSQGILVFGGGHAKSIIGAAKSNGIDLDVIRLRSYDEYEREKFPNLSEQ